MDLIHLVHDEACEFGFLSQSLWKHFFAEDFVRFCQGLPLTIATKLTCQAGRCFEESDEAVAHLCDKCLRFPSTQIILNIKLNLIACTGRNSGVWLYLSDEFGDFLLVIITERSQ